MRFSGLIFLPVLALAIVSGDAVAQTPAPQATPAPQVAPTAPGAAGRQGDALDFVDLRKFLNGQLEAVQRLQKQVDEGMRDAQQAVQTYDEMVAAYRALIDAVGSKSGQVTQIDEFIALYEKYAQEAAGSPNPNRREKSDEFRRIARIAREIRAGFVEELNKAGAFIERLKDFKEEAIDNFRIRQGQKVNDALKAQLDALKSANNRVGEEIKKAEQQNIPTQ